MFSNVTQQVCGWDIPQVFWGLYSQKNVVLFNSKSGTKSYENTKFLF